MKLTAPLVIFSLLLGADATTIAVLGLTPTHTTTTITANDGDRHKMDNFLTGCKTRPFPFVREICMDSPKRRAHIVWQNTGKKDCFIVTSESKKLCDRCIPGSHYTETACTWF